MQKEICNVQTDWLVKSIGMPLIALRNTVVVFIFRPVSGLMSGKIPNLRLPMSLHSGMMQIVSSITVAGAVLALLMCCERTSFPFNLQKNSEAPEEMGRRLQKWLLSVKV